MTIEEKAKAYDEALERARIEYKNEQSKGNIWDCESLSTIFPELKGSEDERIRKAIIESLPKYGYLPQTSIKVEDAIAWLEKQGSEPNWCHHKVDLSNCSEEYRKAYYDGWNNCNMQHSQCKSDGNDVVKCLINGMKFYYEDNKEATWGTEKFSMKVKDILYWLEKQGEPNPYSGVSFKYNGHTWGMCARDNGVDILCDKHIIGHLENQSEQILANSCKTYKDEQKSTDNDIKEALRTEYEKGRADAIAEIKKPAWSEEDDGFLDSALWHIKNSITNGKIEAFAECLLSTWLKSLKERVQPQLKQDWSKEDESYLNTTIAYLKDAKEFKKTAENCINWLKSLKDRVLPQPKKEWSKEDEITRNTLINLVEIFYGGCIDKTEKNRLLNFLKSLKPQNRWKPSDRQMKVLEELVEDNNQRYFYSILKSLYEQLKKLK